VAKIANNLYYSSVKSLYSSEVRHMFHRSLTLGAIVTPENAFLQKQVIS